MISGTYTNLALMILFAGTVLTSCGANIDKREVKEYRITTAVDSINHKETFRTLVKDYNREAGFDALLFVENKEEANSFVTVTEGLEKRDGKVGWGQWLAETERSGVDLVGGSVESVTKYTLSAEFDAEFVREHSTSTAKSSSSELFKLFAHEIGHGFKIEHDPDVKQLMYYDITGSKDYAKYWQQVRSFFEM